MDESPPPQGNAIRPIIMNRQNEAGLNLIITTHFFQQTAAALQLQCSNAESRLRAVAAALRQRHMRSCNERTCRRYNASVARRLLLLLRRRRGNRSGAARWAWQTARSGCAAERPAAVVAVLLRCCNDRWRQRGGGVARGCRQRTQRDASVVTVAQRQRQRRGGSGGSVAEL